MLRGDNIVCGTTTTGTGTLTLAATPGPPGGVDFDVFARATGIGFANSAAVLVSYTIIEYTDTTFSTAKATEKGVGTLTLGSSPGIANATLARTTLQTSATSLNSQPATQNIAPGTGISIGTAANTLVFIGASAADIPAFLPYFNTAGSDSNWGVSPLAVNYTSGAGPTLVSGRELFIPFIWQTPMLVKRASIRVSTAYTGGTPVSNADARLYAFGADGKPGKLLYDFGLLGSAGTSLNSTGNVQSGASGNGYFMTPGEYYFSFLAVVSGGAAGPALFSYTTVYSRLHNGRIGTVNGLPAQAAYRDSATIGAAPDPATTTGWTLISNQGPSSSGEGLIFGLSPT